jgi:hypothetical protein
MYKIIFGYSNSTFYESIYENETRWGIADIVENLEDDTDIVWYVVFEFDKQAGRYELYESWHE